MDNPITILRLKRAKSRRAPMPVSKKPRKPRTDTSVGPNTYTPAGTLLYSFYEAGERAKLTGPSMEEIAHRARTGTPRTRRHNGRFSYRIRDHKGQVKTVTIDNYAAPCDAKGSRPAERRRRQGAHLHQHPSVVARFAGHPGEAAVAS